MAYKSVLKKILAVALALLVWQLGAMALDSSLLLVSPVETARELSLQIRDPAFWGTVGFSLWRILLGFGAAFVTAAVLAALFACSTVMAAAAGMTADSSASSARMLVPVGHTVGIKLFSRGVVVVKLSDGGTPAKACGL